MCYLGRLESCISYVLEFIVFCDLITCKQYSSGWIASIRASEKLRRIIFKYFLCRVC